MSISYNALLVVVFFFAAFAAGQETLQQYPASPPPAPPALVPFFNKTKITVCVSDWTPAVYCKNATKPSDFTGYEVELFRKIMPYMGWTDEMIEWKCMDWDAMEQDLYNSTTCDLAPTGMTPSVERQDLGLRFSTTSLRSGFSIMVSRVQEAPGRWYFLSAMSTTVWCVMIATAVISGLLVWLLEVGMQSLNNDTKWMSNVMWDTVGRPVQMRDYRLSSFAANLLALAWSFAVYILMAMYTANLTANLTLTRIKNDIHGLKDLPGKAVGSWENYAAEMRKYNLAIVPFKWDNADDELKMIQALKEGLIKAVVMPDQTLSLRDAVDCGTMIVGNQFSFTDESHAFPYASWFNAPNLILEYDQAIQRLLLDGAMEELQNRFIKIPQATCKTSSVNEGSVSKVEWQEVTGLWIMMFGALAIGILTVAAYWFIKAAKPWFNKQPWYRKACCMVSDDQSHWGETLSRSYTRLVHLGRNRPAASNLSSSKVGKKNNSEQELWDNRYQGATAGYLDGSADVHDVEAHYAVAQAQAQAQQNGSSAPQQQARFRRSDTANARALATSNSNANGSAIRDQESERRAEFERYVLDQIAELRSRQEDKRPERVVTISIPPEVHEDPREPDQQHNEHHGY